LLAILPVVTEGQPDLCTLLTGARVLAQVGAHDQALADCEAVLARDRDNVQAHLLLALLRDRRGETAAAVSSYEAVLGRGLVSEQEQAVRLAIADVHLRHGNTQQALLVVDEILGQDSSSLEAHLLRGMALSDLGLIEEARGSFEEAARLDPRDERVIRAIDEIESKCVVMVP
jgi:Tfp pilus assembly protein PilF